MMEQEHSSTLPDNHSILPMRVLYADTDRMGVVYHATYLRWFEAGRAHYMRQRGLPYLEIERDGIWLPVVEAHAKYLKPAKYDDVLLVRAWIADIGKAQLTFHYLLTREDEELVKGYTRHASINRDGRPVRLPTYLCSALLSPERNDTYPDENGRMVKPNGQPAKLL